MPQSISIPASHTANGFDVITEGRTVSLSPSQYTFLLQVAIAKNRLLSSVGTTDFNAATRSAHEIKKRLGFGALKNIYSQGYGLAVETKIDYAIVDLPCHIVKLPRGIDQLDFRPVTCSPPNIKQPTLILPGTHHRSQYDVIIDGQTKSLPFGLFEILLELAAARLSASQNGGYWYDARSAEFAKNNGRQYFRRLSHRLGDQVITRGLRSARIIACANEIQVDPCVLGLTDFNPQVRARIQKALDRSRPLERQAVIPACQFPRSAKPRSNPKLEPPRNDSDTT